jgi:hypothetical protein
MLRQFLLLLSILSVLWLAACGGSSDPGGDGGPALDGLNADLDAGPLADAGDADPLGDTIDTTPDASDAAGDAAPQDLDAAADTSEVPVETVASVPILPPPEAPFIISHPLIFDGRLYLHSGGTPGTVAPQYLSAYDLRDNNKLLWATKLSDNAFFVFPGATGTSNLIRSDHMIPIVFVEANGKQRLVEVHAVSGAIVVDRPVQEQWEFTDVHDIDRSWGVIDPKGAVVEHGDELLFAPGTVLDKCNGSVAWTNSGWILFGSEAIVVRNTAIGFDSGASLRVKGIDLGIAVRALKGYASMDAARLFETDSGNHLASTYTTDHLVISRGLIFKGRSYPVAEGDIPADSAFVEAFSATDGSFVFRMPLDLSGLPNQALLGSWAAPLVLGHPAVADGILLMAVQTLTNRGFSRAIVAFDLETKQQLWATPYSGDWSSFVPSAQSVFVVETTKDDANHYTGFTVLQLDLHTGAPLRRLDAPEAHDSGRLMPVLTAAGDEGVLAELAPLLHEGQLFLTCHSTTGSVVAVFPTGDSSANVLQYKYNNQLNPVLNLADPQSNQGEDPLMPQEGDPENSGTSDETDFAVLSDPDPGLDTLPAPSPDPTILASLGLTPETLAALPKDFVGLLAQASYSNSGEESASNIGEGYLKIRSKFGCQRSNQRYPVSHFLTVHWEPPTPLNGMVAGPDFRTWYPDLPLFHSPSAYMTGSNSALYFSYSALEDDESTGIEKYWSYLAKAVDIVTAYVSGNYCAIAEIVASTVAAESSGYVQHFGAPSLTLYQGSDAVLPHFYGLPMGDTKASFFTQASATRPALAAAADAVDAACALNDLASGDFSALEDVMATSIDLFSPDEQSTQGRFAMRLATPLKAKTLKVLLQRVDLEGDFLQLDASTRIGVVGSDLLDKPLLHPAYTAATPFRTLVNWGYQQLAPGEDLAQVLFEASFKPSNDSPGTTAIYTELVFTRRVLGGAMHTAVFSETRFLEDLLYGAWVQDPQDPKAFTKTVRKPFSSRTLQGQVTLTYSVVLH